MIDHELRLPDTKDYEIDSYDICKTVFESLTKNGPTYGKSVCNAATSKSINATTTDHKYNFYCFSNHNDNTRILDPEFQNPCNVI